MAPFKSTKKSTRNRTSTPKRAGVLGMKFIDFMGSEFSLNYPTPTGSHQTSLGGYLTILLGITVLCSSVIFFTQYLNTEAPIVTSSTEFNSNYTEFNLYKEDLFPLLSVVVGSHVMPANQISRYITPKIQIEEYSFSNQTNNYQMKLHQTFDYIPCSSIKDEKVINVLKRMNGDAEGFKTNGLCPDFRGSPNEFRALRNISNSTYIYAKLRIFPCSLTDSRQCASAQELAYATLGYTSNDKLLQSSNFEDPVTLSSEYKNINLEVTTRKKRINELRLNRLEDDTHIIRGPILKAEYVTHHKVGSDFRSRPASQNHCSEAQIALGARGGCQEYLVLDYNPSGKLVKIRRNYRKITTVLGELGGFIKLVTLVSFLCYSYYNARSVKEFIKRNLYKVGELAKLRRAAGKKGRRGSPKHWDGRRASLSSRMSHERLNKVAPKNSSILDPKKYEKVLDQCVEDRRSGMDMMSKLDFVQIMQELFFEAHDKVLLPLLILRLKEKQMSRKAQNSQKNRQRGKRRVSFYSKKSTTTNQEKRKNSPEIDNNNTKMGYSEAYQRLITSNPKSTIKKAIRRLMVENLNPLFLIPSGSNKELENIAEESLDSKNWLRRRENDPMKIEIQEADEELEGGVDCQVSLEELDARAPSINRDLEDSKNEKNGSSNMRSNFKFFLGKTASKKKMRVASSSRLLRKRNNTPRVFNKIRSSQGLE